MKNKSLNKRGTLIFSFCDELHEDVNNLYEAMMDGNENDEKTQIAIILNKLKEQNIDL